MLRSIFISSTFRDMNHERDVIHTKVTPVLNSLAQKHGESVTTCDLRWGIDTSDMNEQNSAKKVLDVCLDEIDRCRPYMIVILGYRYGWIPDEEMITSTLRAKGDITLSDNNISVTALEIEYGSLLSSDSIDHTLFYFREIDGDCKELYLPEDKEHKEKLDQLKARIQSTPGAHVKTYHVDTSHDISDSMDKFADMVIKDLHELFLPEWLENEQLDMYALDQKKQWAFLSEKSAQFLARSEVLSQSIDTVCEKKDNLLLHGAAGCGKSTLLSKLGYELQQRKHRVIPIYCAHTPLCSSGFDIVKYIVWELECALGIENHLINTTQNNLSNPAVWYEYTDVLLKQYSAEATQELVFIIDGTDQLIFDDIAQNFTFIPRNKYEHILFVISMITSDNMPNSCAEIALEDLTTDERKQVVQGILSSKHRELSDDVVDSIVQLESSRLPLYLSMVVQRLLMMNYEDFNKIVEMGSGIDAITDYQLTLVNSCPEKLEELAVHILNHASKLIGGNAMNEVAEYLAISRRGLRLSDIEGLMSGKDIGWNLLDTVAFIQYMGSMFNYRSDGRIDFSHNSIRQGYLEQCADTKNKHTEICKWLFDLPDNDEVRSQEVVWHAIIADQKRAFCFAAAQATQSESNLSGITKDTVDMVISDHGRWLMDAIKECFHVPYFSSLGQFVNYNVFFGIIDTPSNLQTKLDICELMTEAHAKRCAISETHGSLWDLSVAYDRLASIHRDFETKEHIDKSVAISKYSLMIRTELLNRIAELDNNQKRKIFLEENLVSAGLSVTDTIPEDKYSFLIAAFADETTRGLCVANEDIARAKRDGTKDDLLLALDHLQQSIGIRERMLSRHNREQGACINDEYVELAHIYSIAANICLDLSEPKHLKLAKKYCFEAIEICEAAIKIKKTNYRLAAMCEAYSQTAKLYFMGKSISYDDAIDYCMRCASILEGIDIQECSAESRTSLADIYNQLGNLYESRGDESGRLEAEKYFKKGQSMAQDVAVKFPNITSKRNLMILNRNLAENQTIDGAEEISTVVSDSYITAYQEAIRILDELGSESAYEDVCNIYDSVIRTVKNAKYIGNDIRERVLFELRIRKLDCLLLIRDSSNDNIRKTIVNYVGTAESIINVDSLTDNPLPDDMIEMLSNLNVSKDVLLDSKYVRALQLTEKAVALSEALAEKTESLADYDILAVTLMKRASLCMLLDPSKFAEAQAKLMPLAHKLHNETHDEKYLTMIAMGMMVSSMLASDEDPTVDVPVKLGGEWKGLLGTDPDELRQDADQTRAKIAKLETEKNQLHGLFSRRKRKKIQEEIDMLKKILECMN